MEKWQWELRKALKRWKLAIMIVDQPVPQAQLERAAAEKGIRNISFIDFLNLTPKTPHQILKDYILTALCRSHKPIFDRGEACVAVMSQELLDHYLSWTGGWFIELFESHTKIIKINNKPDATADATAGSAGRQSGTFN